MWSLVMMIAGMFWGSLFPLYDFLYFPIFVFFTFISLLVFFSLLFTFGYPS